MTYHEQTDVENTLKLREVLKSLPDFANDFFRAVSTTTSTSTRIKYAYDLRIFFQFLLTENPVFRKYTMEDLKLDVLDSVTALDIEEYIEYLKAYKDSRDEYTTNGEKGLKRKLSSLRTFYAYFFKKDITLLLGTGIRVSECVGLDIEDVDFKNNGIKVMRKGGNEMIVYFGSEVEKALRSYIEVRDKIEPLPGHEHALFYSSQRKRINVKTVENLVKKYASQVTTTKKITPHKLRSTYGTTLYQETGDIYLVADVLGHKDVNTTKKHYAAIDDARRRKAASAVKLREE